MLIIVLKLTHINIYAHCCTVRLTEFSIIEKLQSKTVLHHDTPRGPTNPRGPIPPPTCGGLWTCPPKSTPEGIEPKTLRGATPRSQTNHYRPTQMSLTGDSNYLLGKEVCSDTHLRQAMAGSLFYPQLIKLPE